MGMAAKRRMKRKWDCLVSNSLSYKVYQAGTLQP